jgi:valyl-tRNA synthetase
MLTDAGGRAGAQQGIAADAYDRPRRPTRTDWLLARLDSTTTRVRRGRGSSGFDFGAMAQALYHFVWDDFCSWALELSKPRLSSARTRPCGAGRCG